MKIGIFDPYLDTLGGGEKYILTIASYLSQNHSVSLFWNPYEQRLITQEAAARFGIDITSVSFVPNIFNSHVPFFQRMLATHSYDVIFFVSDGSIPTLFAKKNILILQFSVNWVKKTSIKNKIKFRNIYATLCYSSYIKQFIDKTFGINSIVLPPAVEPIPNSNIKKQNIILSVGRFTKAMNTKKQEILIEAFKKLYSKNKEWKFVIIGSHLDQDRDYVDQLIQVANGYPIEIKANISHKELIKYYQQSKMYWHAAGFGEDLSLFPERAEHFGITTVEAMSAGCVPVVFNAGGQKEIVKNQENGILWNSQEELIKETDNLINKPKLWEKLSKNAKKSSYTFSPDHFYQEINKIIT